MPYVYEVGPINYFNLSEPGGNVVLARFAAIFESGASWTAVIHHLRHLEENSLIVKEKVPHDRGGPSLLYRALDLLKELRERGWLPNNGGGSPNGASGTR